MNTTLDSRTYDVFLAHSSGDAVFVEEVARRLRREGLRPFFSPWHIIPGQVWLETLENALGESATVAVCLGPAATGPWREQERQLALDRATEEPARLRVIPVLLPGGHPEQVPGFLKLRSWVDLRGGLDDAGAFRRLVAGIRGHTAEPGADPEPPAGSPPAPTPSEELAAWREAAAVRLRRTLQQKAPRTEAAASRRPIHEVFWVPTVMPRPAKRWALTEVVELAEGPGPSLATAFRQRLEDGAGAEGDPGSETRTEAGGRDAGPAGAGRTPAEEMVAVVFGEAGAGKSVLSRLLALGLVEGTEVVPGLPAWLCGRDLPVLVDLKQHAADLLAGPGDPAAVVRGCIRASWGAEAVSLLDAREFADRGLIVLDGVESLLWPAWGRVPGAREGGAEDVPDACALVLGELFGCFPGIPRVVTMRRFGEKWLAAMGVRHTGYEIAPVTAEDVRQIAGVHLYGRRDAAAAHPDDPRLGRLLHNRDIRRFASSPMFVKLALDILGAPDDAAALTTDRIIGHYYDQAIARGRVDSEEPLPVPEAVLRGLLRRLAHRLSESGGSVLSQAGLLECGAALGLGDALTRRAAWWLGDRTELISAEPDGGLSFTHDWYQETLAGEELAAHHSAGGIVALAGAQRWHEPVKYAAGLAAPGTAREVIFALLDAGHDGLALDAWVQAAGRLPGPEGDELLGRLYTLSLGDVSKRLRLVAALAELDTPAARRLLVDAALPLLPLSTRDAFERFAGYPWPAQRDAADDTIRTQMDRVSGFDHLLVNRAVLDDGTLVVAYAGEEGDFGGSWACASICATLDPEKLPGNAGRTFVSVLGPMLARMDEDVAAAVAEATLQRHDVPEQLMLLALALLAERLFSAGRTAEEAGSRLALLVRGLQDVTPSESPAFTIGLVNAVLTRVPHIAAHEASARLRAIRRAAVLEHAKHVGAFFHRTSRGDGYWVEPPASPSPEEPPPPRTAEVVARIRAALREMAGDPPVPSPPAPWKARSLADAFIARLGHMVHKVKAKDTTGRWAYYFVLVMKEYEESFLKAIEGDGTIDLEDYGTVVASCYGEEPTDEVRDFLKNFGFDA